MSTTIHGRETGVALENPRPLIQPWKRDPWGHFRPAFSPEAMQLSVELASTTYDMAVDDWLRAGWRDINIQMEDSLAPALAGIPYASPVEAISAGVKLKWLQAQLHPKLVLGQLAGTLKQRDTSNTCTALVMAHELDGGEWVIAIGFMGTGAQLYDWISNFRLGTEEGYHQGFLQLVRQFEANEEAIVFPSIAKTMGLEKLTLGDILMVMRDEHCPYHLWLAGHSQGGALMQVWLDRQVKAGLKPSHAVGYGFASPSVTVGNGRNRADSLPLYHVFNSDDLVPRMGCRCHLGELLIYPADLPMRAASYKLPSDEAGVAAWQAVYRLAQHGEDTRSCLALGLATLDACTDLPQEELGALLLRGDIPEQAALRRVAQAAGDQMGRLVRYTRRRFAAVYAEAAGHPPRAEEIAPLEHEVREAMAQVGRRELLQAAKDYALSAHSCHGKHGMSTSAYIWIAMYGADQLIPAHWEDKAQLRLIKASRALSRLEDTPHRPRAPRRPRAQHHLKPGGRQAGQRRGRP